MVNQTLRENNRRYMCRCCGYRGFKPTRFCPLCGGTLQYLEEDKDGQ